MQPFDINFVFNLKYVDMKHHLKAKYLIVVLVLCSVISALYLDFQAYEMKDMLVEQNYSNTYIKDVSCLPDVKFVKELLKSIFNVVKA